MKPGDLSAYIVDDEPLAVKRLTRLIKEDGRVTILGSSTDPDEAVGNIEGSRPDVIFLDIEMPGMSGFDLLARLEEQPFVVFTTAYNAYALRAFEVNSIDYLLKPIDPAQLDRAIGKLERMRRGGEPRPDLTAVVDQLNAALRGAVNAFPSRLSSKTGDRVQFVELARVTHIHAQDKLTYAVEAGRDHVVDATIAQLEQRLDPNRFVRIHRSTIVNLDYVHELYTWFGGRMLLRLKDDKHTELTVARDRVRVLKERLGV